MNRCNPISLISVLLLCCNACLAQTNWVNSTELHFKLPPKALRVTSLADWNNQNRVGFIGTWEDRASLVWYCSKEGGDDLYSVCWESAEFSEPIVSTIVADLNRDGVLDILVQGEGGSLFFIDGNNRSLTPAAIETGGPLNYDSTIPQISIVNVDGTCGLSDIAFVDTNGSLIVLSATTETSKDGMCRGEGLPTFEPEEFVTGEKGVREVVPLSIISDDIDGDCVADLLYMVHTISTNIVEVYAFFPRTARHELLLTLSDANRYGFPSTADINGDGAPDLIFPLCRTEGELKVFGNCSAFNGVAVFQNNLQGSTSCRGSSCCTGHPYGFLKDPSSIFLLQDNANCGIDVSADFPLFIPNSRESPLILRAGDCDRDGYVDLLVPSTRGPLLIQSAANPNGTFLGCTPVDDALTDHSKKQSLPFGSATAFFATISGKGQLDIVLTYHGSEVVPLTLYVSHTPSLEQNYFLTGSALNGVGTGDPWGLYQPSAVHRFGWNDITMKKRWAYGSQMSRSQGHALQSPQLFFGLGRTFSYVQEYTVGILFRKDALYHRWSANLVPNSHVFTWMQPLASADRWRLQLYLAFATYKELLLIVLGTVLVSVGLLIALLRWRELRQDQRELKLR
ncbi:FG-GAP repeat protein, putative [Trypanosoma equiperdum]|uniref:FG-GAP repeat protein, putative n=2 Tax=Trypanozoon TaxID=39700 RepID=Q383A8_TRYB2|nr:uncharacterized protein Tb11.01.3590 [Trypanosoma brucei brucei TREU927]EAN80123.1 FG-GAP repeat protein, putative [Trypanosoma brucei brucei TREU927]SCU72409.1 FG-GAP repeat protein, putative [Trypanosoma equiperdum]